ncbi:MULTISPECIES: chorismate synthase [Peptoniphilus]|uniref:chorismate synthase n=1 Tax=Peptoniphilus TaxID=162289 RepID=UPI0008D9AC96|nr:MULTISPECIES: chorismate synthase [Peptoniphilus]MBS6611146.1 chorismate synthase [Peptoniphilus harei]MDU1044096.1 chorismate synthase [Peptoniphilus rhinitidis]MDU2110593.1 chorismate synthase [Peptoniphilus lacydonensis]MDU3751352.1 chorismate synthase [Peptoniphilus rhinitidis]
MSYSFGNNFKITLFGQSHSKEIGIVIDGVKTGYKINYDLIEKNLDRRRPGKNKFSTSRKELDEFKIVSGEVDGITCGAPLSIIIKNKDQKSEDYENLKDHPRPSHADYPAYVKYNGYNDIRGGGQFSGRMTAPIVIAGSIAEDLLLKRNIKIISKIKSIGQVNDVDLNYEDLNNDEFYNLKNSYFPVFDKFSKEEMQKEILDAKEKSDSIGGIIETAILNMPIGIGEPFFDSMESVISHAIFSVPGVKGIEFGSGFEAAKMFGSYHNDSYYYDNGKVKTKTNNHGGIIGGLSTSMPIIFRTAIKPTSSIGKAQETISIKNKKVENLKINGRHDPSIVPRAVVALETMTAIAILDLVIEGEKWKI